MPQSDRYSQYAPQDPLPKAPAQHDYAPQPQPNYIRDYSPKGVGARPVAKPKHLTMGGGGRSAGGSSGDPGAGLKTPGPSFGERLRQNIRRSADFRQGLPWGGTPEDYGDATDGGRGGDMGSVWGSSGNGGNTGNLGWDDDGTSGVGARPQPTPSGFSGGATAGW
jgi:hypothetical protein